MSPDTAPRAGTIAWHDLTIENAADVRDFYASVVGWKVENVSQGEYDDFSMVPPGADGAVAGICHARGSNTGLPAQWLMYVIVEDLDRSLEATRAAGGEVAYGPREMGQARMAVVRDPAGAVLALYQE